MKKILDILKSFKIVVEPKYDHHAFGIETTWNQGLGLGIGLGKRDVWIGLPRNS